MDILEISHIAKTFGNKKVIDDLSFSVPEHSVFGFIGQNGAGKTTTMKMVLGLLESDKGEIYVNGEKVTFGENHTNRYIGYLPDVPEFYGFMTPKEYLAMCGQITGMSKEEIRKKSAELLKMVGLEENHKRIQGFSRGMKQRLGIAQALLNSPKLLICDEPTSALDPMGRKEILDILSSVRKHTTVIFSTHILSDVERICDRIAFLHEGKIALSGTLEEIKHVRNGDSIEIEFLTEKDRDTFLKIYSGGRKTGRAKVLFSKKTERDMLEIMECLSQNKIPILRLERLEPTLEDLFLEVAGK
ncbi:MAG: ABC transporter ATP-binding protein [Lachnospiraceae bacterium]|nr:ABC transporter ATP-binding protein [Lachnospiraceae bacterium]